MPNKLTLAYKNKDTMYPNRLVKKCGPDVECIMIEETWTDDWSERIERNELVYDSETGQCLRIDPPGAY